MCASCHLSDHDASAKFLLIVSYLLVVHIKHKGEALVSDHLMNVRCVLTVTKETECVQFNKISFYQSLSSLMCNILYLLIFHCCVLNTF